MTVIAWDGKTLAADKASTNCGYRSTVTKIHRVGDAIVALAGKESALMEALHWLRDGADPARYPEAMRNSDSLMWVIRRGEFLRYEAGPYPARVESLQMATGTGRDYALAAMHLGFDAVRAVEVACALDNACGNGIDTLTLGACPHCNGEGWIDRPEPVERATGMSFFSDPCNACAATGKATS